MTRIESHNAKSLPTVADRQRHEALVKTVFDWMSRTRCTQQRLVQCVEEFWRRRGEPGYKCDHSLVSRILNPVSPHVPTPHRPKSMKILQAAMVICSAANDPNLVAPALDEDALWSSDDEQAFKLHRSRLRQLRDHGREPLYQALSRMGEFVSTAVGMDDVKAPNEFDTFRQRACENTLLTLAAVIDSGDSGQNLAARLQADGVDSAEVARLVAQQAQRVDKLLACTAPTINMHAYAGPTLFYAGQRDRGMEMLMQAAAASHDMAQRHDPHWETLLELLDRLLGQNDAGAANWSKQASRIAAQNLAASDTPGKAALLRRAWQCMNVPRVREHWSDVSPQLVKALDETPAPATPSTPGPNKGSRKAGKSIAALLALALTLLAVHKPHATAAAPYADDQVTPQPQVQLLPLYADDALSIHGREASNPPPPGGGGSPAPVRPA